MTVASANFQQTRTPDNFRVWYQESPKDATQYLQSVAVHAGNVTVLNALDQMTQAPPADAPAAATDLFTQLDAAALGATQAERTGTLGWEAAGPPLQPPPITGRLSMATGSAVLETALGTFNLQNMNPVGGNDLSAFTDRVVTVKGWPDANWQPGVAGPATLVVQEFGPGASEDFVTGRVVAPAGAAGDMFINTGTQQVKITDQTLKDALANFNDLGIVLPGPVELEGTQATFKGSPEGYYILAGFSTANAPTVGPDQVSFTLQLAHGKTVQTTVPAAEWNASQRTSRHYLFGRFEGGSFAAQAITPPAGGFSGPLGAAAGAPSTKFVEYATPAEKPTFNADESSFAPGKPAAAPAPAPAPAAPAPVAPAPAPVAPAPLPPAVPAPTVVDAAVAAHPDWGTVMTAFAVNGTPAAELNRGAGIPFGRAWVVTAPDGVNAYPIVKGFGDTWVPDTHGRPLNAEYADPAVAGGFKQDFEKGTLTWSETAGIAWTALA